MKAKTKDQIANKDQALETITRIMHLPRTGWIKPGSRSKANELVEMPRNLAKELADKTLCFYLMLEEQTYDPFCNCKQVEALLLKAIQELPEGDTVYELEQVMFRFCPACGKKFEG